MTQAPIVREPVTWDDPTMPPILDVTLEGNPEASRLTKAVAGALRLAATKQRPLPADLLAMPGFSGQRYRVFINSLLKRLPLPRYLEVGSWAGSTLCSALYGNPDVDAVAVDNWSEFGGPRAEFTANLARFVTDPNQVEVVEADFRTVDFKKLGPVDVYLFDGPHLEEDQYDGIAMAVPALAKHSVIIVDDWNWERVRVGTRRAMAEQGLNVIFEAQIRTTTHDYFPDVSRQESDWHNGYLIAVVDKT